MTTKYQIQKILSEHPWIRNFVNRNPAEGFVQRIDPRFLFTKYGRSGYDNASYNRFYVVDKQGALLNEVAVSKPHTWYERLLPNVFCVFTETVFDGLLRTAEEHKGIEIGYVLEINGPGSFTLHKPPKQESLKEMLLRFKEQTKEQIEG